MTSGVPLQSAPNESALTNWFFLRKTISDTYSKVAFGKLYDRNTPITAADLLKERVENGFFNEHGIGVSLILTDRGTEYCETPEQHRYEVHLAVENIDHSRTKTKRPAGNRHLRALPQDRARRVLQGGPRKHIYKRWAPCWPT